MVAAVAVAILVKQKSNYADVKNVNGRKSGLMRDKILGRAAKFGWRTPYLHEKRRARNMEAKQWQNEALQELAEEEYEDLFKDGKFNPSSPDWHAAVSNLIDER